MDTFISMLCEKSNQITIRCVPCSKLTTNVEKVYGVDWPIAYLVELFPDAFKQQHLRLYQRNSISNTKLLRKKMAGGNNMSLIMRFAKKSVKTIHTMLERLQNLENRIGVKIHLIIGNDPPKIGLI